MAKAKKVSVDKLTLNWQIEYVPLETIKPYFNNPRQYSESQVNQLAKVIKEGGFDVPMVVDENDVLIKGHRRRLASKKLNLAIVPIIRRTDLSEDEKRAMRISDNKLAESPWDEALLAEEIAQLQEAGFDLSLTGFYQEELDQLLKNWEDSQTEYQEGQIFGLNTNNSNGGGLPSDNKDLSEEEFAKTKHKCPSCGFQW